MSGCGTGRRSQCGGASFLGDVECRDIDHRVKTLGRFETHDLEQNLTFHTSLYPDGLYDLYPSRVIFRCAHHRRLLTSVHVLLGVDFHSCCCLRFLPRQADCSYSLALDPPLHFDSNLARYLASVHLLGPPSGLRIDVNLQAQVQKQLTELLAVPQAMIPSS